MVTIQFLGPIAREPIQVKITNFKQLQQLLLQDKNLRPWIDSLAIALNDTIIKDTNITFKDGDTITLLPPVCGG
jgi:molybdopterin synthase sulfur carrier subunit